MKVVIIGSGPTGLSCAKKLNGKIDYIIFEKENKIGGLAKSVEKNNFIFDYSGHLLHLRWKETTDFVFNILQNNLIKIKRNAQIYLKGYFVDYPFQINLYNLPADIKSKCVSDFIKAYSREKKETKNFYKWALNTFGKSICNYFMFPYNEKLFSFDIKKLTINWLGNFVPKPDINLVLKGAYQKKIENIGYNPVFYYPKNGGIGSLTNAISIGLKNIKTNSEVIFTNFNKKTVMLKNGSLIKYDILINTSPLKYFILNSNAPQNVKKAAEKLKHNKVYILNLGIKKTNFKQHWIYFPEKKFLFYRLGFYTNFSKNLSPKGFSSIYIEFSTNENGYINTNEAEKKVIKDLINLGIIKNEDDIKTIMWLLAECAYVIYDEEREENLKIIFDYLDKNSVISTGRYGGWKYSFIEENIKDGFEAAKKIIELKGG